MSSGYPNIWFGVPYKKESVFFYDVYSKETFLVESGVTPFWHVVFGGHTSIVYEKHSKISKCPLHIHHRIINTIKKLQGCPILIKITNVMKTSQLFKLGLCSNAFHNHICGYRGQWYFCFVICLTKYWYCQISRSQNIKNYHSSTSWTPQTIEI